MRKKDFIHINDLNKDQIHEIFDKAKWIKDKFKNLKIYFNLKSKGDDSRILVQESK